MIRKSFTLIETLVAVGILAILLVTVGGIMLMSFKGKTVTENNEMMSSRAVFILGELKRNILNAEIGKITCPRSVGTSISFVTKDGGQTTLFCDEVNGQVASQSASGNFNFLDSSSSVRILNCDDFVWCNLSNNSEILSVGFSLNLAVGSGGEIGSTGVFYQLVSPRE